MKKLLIIIAGLCLSGCSLQNTATPSQNNTTTTGIVIDTPGTPQTRRSLSSTQYTSELLNNPPILYNGSGFTAYKITDTNTNRRTYFISYSGDIASFFSHIYTIILPSESVPEHVIPTLSGGDRSQVQIPVDHSLSIYQSQNSSEIFILDYDDPSALKNMMSHEDIQLLLQHLSIVEM